MDALTELLKDCWLPNYTDISNYILFLRLRIINTFNEAKGQIIVFNSAATTDRGTKITDFEQKLNQDQLSSSKNSITPKLLL